MWKLVIARLIAAVPVLFMVAVVTFVLFRFMPVQAPAAILGDSATPEAVERLTREMGLDRPAPVLFLEWLGGALRGEFGNSYVSGREVTTEIALRLPITLTLAVGGILVAMVIGIPIGVAAALARNSILDRLLTSAVSLLLAVPGFWMGLLLVLFFAIRLRWLPAAGYTPPGASLSLWFVGFILPWLSLGLGLTASIARQARSAMIEQLGAPYVRALVARGTPRWRIVFLYCLKNALIPVLAIVGMLTAYVIGGSFVVEQVFAIPGLGSLILDAVNRGDVPILQAVILVVAFFVILINLLVDIGYGLLDPKVRPE